MGKGPARATAAKSKPRAAPVKEEKLSPDYKKQKPGTPKPSKTKTVPRSSSPSSLAETPVPHKREEETLFMFVLQACPLNRMRKPFEPFEKPGQPSVKEFHFVMHVLQSVC